jgi:hypothetical protein
MTDASSGQLPVTANFLNPETMHPPAGYTHVVEVTASNGWRGRLARGPVLGGSRPPAACRLAGSTPVGHGQLVEGLIERLELPDLEDPLAYLHGRYRSVRDLGEDG